MAEQFNRLSQTTYSGPSSPRSVSVRQRVQSLGGTSQGADVGSQRPSMSGISIFYDDDAFLSNDEEQKTAQM